MNSLMKVFLVLILSIFTMAVYGQVAVPDVDITAKLLEMFASWKTMSPLLKGIGFVMIITQVVKQITGFKYQRLLVTILAIIYGALDAMIGGGSAVSSLMTILISGGGASALYELLKPLLSKISFLDFLKLKKDA